MHKKLSQKYLDALNNDSTKDLFIRDASLTGFGVKITPKNNIVYFAEGRIKKGKPKRVTLGRYPSLDINDARRKARKALNLLRDGIDPLQLEKEVREELLASSAKAEALSVTLKDLMTNFFEARQLKSEADYQKVLNSCFADWLDKPVRSITRQSVEKFYKRKAFKEGHKAQAAKATRYLSSIMTYGKAEIISGEKLIIENPVDVLKEKRIDRSVKPKERYVEREQLFNLIRAFITECTEDARDLLLLQLFTGLRDQESKTIRWTDLDFKEKTITITNNKSSRTHIIPMGKFLYALLKVRAHKKVNKDYVFSNRDNSNHIGIVRKQVLKVTKKTGIEFSHHDLRRTFATLLEGELKVSESIISRLLNHSPKTVTGKHYIKSSARQYTSEANKLYELIAADHDWTNDDGQKTGEGDWFALAEREYEGHFADGYERSLINVLFRDAFINLSKEKEDVDWKYIDADISVANGVPWLYLNS